MANKVGQFCINVTDLERSERFYTDVLGLKVQMRSRIPGVEEVVLGADEGGGRIQLAQHLERKGAIDHGTALWKLYIQADDCETTYRRAVDAGATSKMEPKRLDEWPVTVAFVADPDGYEIEILQRHEG